MVLVGRLLVAVMIGCALAPVAAQDTFETVRQNVREGEPYHPPPPSSPPAAPSSPPAPNPREAANGPSYFEQQAQREREKEQQEAERRAGNASFGLAFLGLFAPYWLPMSLDSGYDKYLEFPTHPYDKSSGYLVSDESEFFDAEYFEPESSEPIEWWRLRKSREWGGRVSTEYGASFDGQQWIGARALVEGNLRFGVDLDVRHWEQTNDPAMRDSLWLGKSDVLYRFAQNEYMQFRSGLGVNWMDDFGSDWGLNFTYGVDWFPIRPLVLSSEVDLGSLGQALLFHFRSSAGVIWGPTEFFVAFDYYEIGDAQLRGVAGGLRIWF